MPTSPSDQPEQQPRVVVFGREGCHLCAVAVEVVAQVCGELAVAWEVVDVDDDEERADAARVHPDEIPVTFVDGRQHDFWRVDPDRLRTALRAGAGG